MGHAYTLKVHENFTVHDIMSDSQQKKGFSERIKPKSKSGSATKLKKSSTAQSAPQQQGEPTSQGSALQSQLAALQKERDDLQEKFVRLAAESKNLQMRMERDKSEIRKFALTEPLKGFSLVYEDILRAIESVPEGEAPGDLLTGLELTRKNFYSTLEKYGVSRIYPLGEQFNHDFHQALSFVETQDYESGAVAQVVQAGYMIHDRLLNPALVIIAKSPESGSE